MSRDNNKTSSFFGFNKRFTSYFALLLIAPLIQVIAPSAASAVSANSVTISSVGASTWTVPSNVSSVTIAFYGAQGGRGGNDGYAGGTPSPTVAKITGTINVTPGATLKVGNQLSRSTFGNCLVRATKASDRIYSAINSQNINFTFYGSTVQAPISVIATSTFAALGQSIILSTMGGSSTGAVSYVISGGSGSGTITGSNLTASSVGTVTVVATKQGDSQYASIVSSAATFTFTP